MMTIHTNSAALRIRTLMNSNDEALSQTQLRLGTGLRVNASRDDASGMQIASRLRSMNAGLIQASSNINNAVSILQSGDNALKEMEGVLQRMQQLATQAADSTTSATDRVALQKEYDQMGREVASMVLSASYGGEKLFAIKEKLKENIEATEPVDLGGLFSRKDGLKFQIGAGENDKMSFESHSQVVNLIKSLTEVSETAKGELYHVELTEDEKKAIQDQIDANKTAQDDKQKEIDEAEEDDKPKLQQELDKLIEDGEKLKAQLEGSAKNGNDLGTAESASTLLTTMEGAVKALGALRADFGAANNRLGYTQANLGNTRNTTIEAIGRIMDADYAAESSNLANQSVLKQVGNQMLKQANQSSQMILQLISN